MAKGSEHHERQKCGACKGAGVIFYDCPDCWGSSYPPSIEVLRKGNGDPRQCPTCKGKGKVRDHCLACCGSGTR